VPYETHHHPPYKPRSLVYVCPVDHEGNSVYVKGWISSNNPDLPIIIVHDLGESIDFYESFSHILAQQNFNVYGFDMRGQGQSNSKPGQIPSPEHLAKDLLQVVAWVRHTEKGRKPVIIGQGLGALVTLFFAAHFQQYCQSLIFVSPLFAINPQLSRWRRGLISTLAQFVPTLSTPKLLTPNMVFRIRKDLPKMHSSKVSLRFTEELLLSLARARKSFNKINIPTLLLCSVKDPICRFDHLKRLVQKHKHADRFTLISTDGLCHHILTEDEGLLHEACDHILPWIKQKQHKSPHGEEHKDS